MTLLRADEIRELDSPTPYLVEPEPDSGLLEDIHLIESDGSITQTQCLQLTKARIGQGLFRKRVILLDAACRVTGVTDTRLLIASHIKPWRDAANPERISGYNGVLLSPHVDALFDERLITFENDGRMHVHPSLSQDVLRRWSIDPDKPCEQFRREQESFLAHHRKLFANRVV